MFLSELQKNITKTLFNAGIETNSLDARIILKETFDLDEKELIMNSDVLVSTSKVNEVKKILLRRLKGEPVSKIFRKREFYNSTFLISDDVLDPRPETELIIDIANKYISQNNYKSLISSRVRQSSIIHSSISFCNMMYNIILLMSNASIS